MDRANGQGAHVMVAKVATPGLRFVRRMEGEGDAARQRFILQQLVATVLLANGQECAPPEWVDVPLIEEDAPADVSPVAPSLIVPGG